LDLDEDHLAGPGVEDLVLDPSRARVADAAREIRENLLAVRHRPQPARSHWHDHVVVLVAVRAGAGAGRQAIPCDARPRGVDLAIYLSLRCRIHSLRAASISMSSARKCACDPFGRTLRARWAWPFACALFPFAIASSASAR